MPATLRDTLPHQQENPVATIANGQSLSDAIDLGGLRLVSIVMPSAWTAANLTFQVSHDGTTYNNLYDAGGSEVTTTAAASRYIYLDPAFWSGIRFLKVRSGTSGAAVAQGAERLVTLVCRIV